ncbi:MAG TPA: hypothetical protein DCS93_03825 [Microscillaceae bacterium]|nr:hypothetical protein [Microscillaceae bacterium]
MRFLRIITQLMVFLCLCIAQVQAQNFPFPQNKTYDYGLKPQNASAQDAQKAYNTWKTNFLTPCANGRYRVKFDNPSQTVSEGIAYGMLLTAYAGEQTIFDGLWKYYLDHANNNGFMNWRIEGCSNASGFNGATDGDLDATMALIVAHYQWGSQGAIDYQKAAKDHVARIKQHEVESGTFVLKPGDAFGGSSLTNPSYFSPAYYRVFGQFTNDQSFWNQVADKSYEVINKNLSVNSAAGGLVSDWCSANGSHSSQAGGYFSGGRRYHYDAARTPWRIATDYIWFGTAEAATYCKKASDFVRVQLGGSTNIKDGYYQNGSVYGQYHNSTFVGAFANAAIAGEQQAHLDASYTDLANLNDDFSYFNQSLKTLYLFQLTGNFFLPTSGGGTPVNQKPQVAITTPANLASFEINQLINIEANASDIDGEVVKIELLVDGQKVTESTGSSLSYGWQNSTPGTYVLVAKAYDNDGAQNSSASVTIDLFDPTVPQNCQANLERPASNWVVRNAWADQNNQSGTSNETNYLKVTHRQWGQDYLWVINQQKPLQLTPNQVYQVSFGLQVDPNHPVTAIEAAFVSNISWNGPQQVYTSAVSEVTSSSGFKNYTITLKAPANSEALLAFKLSWNGQPSTTIHQWLKQIQVCSSNGTPPPPPVNQKPEVSIASPVNATDFEAGQTINVAVNASDADGQVTKTVLYIDDQKVAEANGGALSFEWKNSEAGSHILKAKAYDNQNAENTSTIITVNVIENNAPAPTPGCQQQLGLPASNWVVRNGWNDQNNQSGASSGAGNIKVTHRAWGQNFLWAINTGKPVQLQANQTYELSFELQSSSSMPPASLEMGWVSDIIWNGPKQIHKLAVVELGQATNGFRKYTVRLTATANTTALLGFKFSWDGQPPLESSNYLKNIQLCSQTQEKRRRSPKISSYPNPTLNGVVQVKGIPENLSSVTYVLRDNQGKVLTSGTKTIGEEKSFGLLQFDLEKWMKNPGSYLLEIRSNQYRKMMTILKR